MTADVLSRRGFLKRAATTGAAGAVGSRRRHGGPIGRLHFAGTETPRQFWGNMEAAMGTGERAAQEILSA
jgi:monoamine oxidase